MPVSNMSILQPWIDQCCGPVSDDNIEEFEYCTYNYLFDENNKKDPWLEAVVPDKEHGKKEERENDYCNINRSHTFPYWEDETNNDTSFGYHSSNNNPNNVSILSSKGTRTFDELADMNYDEFEISIAEESKSKSNPFCEFVLPHEAMKQIAVKGLPPGLLFSTWTRVYSLARDGDSFEMMLRLVKDHKCSLLTIRTTKDEIFGGFVTSPWTTESNGGFYGSGQSILFTISRPSKSSQARNSDDSVHLNGNSSLDPSFLRKNKQLVRKDIDVKIYKWSGKNQYIQLCDSEKSKLVLGGGGDNLGFGLCIENDFQRGSTGKCETFNNEPLTEDGREFFEILDIEIWGFQTCSVFI